MTKKDYTEFNVGDKVRRVKGRNHGSSIGHEAIISSIERPTGKDLFGDCLLWATFEDGTSGYLKSFEYVEPEVKEPKFKVGDRVTENCGKWISGTGNKIVKVTETDYYIAPSYDESMSFPYSIEVWDNRLELVESANQAITVNSRWTSIGKESKTVTVVHVNDKYVTFEHDGRGTIETTTHDIFYYTYKPYVQPPKSLVGYVGVHSHRRSGNISFGAVFESEEDVKMDHSSISPVYDLLAVKKIEWTEGE